MDQAFMQLFAGHHMPSYSPPIMNQTNAQSNQHEARPTASVDWTRQQGPSPATNGTPTPSSVSSTAQSSSTGDSLDQLFGLTSSAPPAPNGPPQLPPHFYNGQYQQYALFPGQQQWTPNSVPVSHYSALSGATSAMQSRTENGQPQYTPPSSTPTPQYSQSPPPQTASNYFPFNQRFLAYPTQSPVQQQQYSPPAQGTLSPQILHAPNVNLGIPPAQFYGNRSTNPPSTDATPPPNSTATTPTDKQTPRDTTRFLDAIRPLISKNAMTGGGAVRALTNKIDDYGALDVNPDIRKEILTAIRDYAANTYFRSWSENHTAMEITGDWLREAALNEDKEDALVDTVMPLLHILDRLPVTLAQVRQHKLGKQILKFSKNPPSPAIKDMALNVERKWREALQKAKEDEAAPKAKRQKVESGAAKPSSSVGSVTTKKPAPVAKAPAKKPATTKSESSFFAPAPPPASRPVKKLPISKLPKIPKREDPSPTPPPAPPVLDPFEEAKRGMIKSDAVVNTPPTMMDEPMGVAGPSKKGKGKSVRWRENLADIREIEKAVYDDDEDGPHMSVKDLEKAEGAALRRHGMSELIPWSEPIEVDMPEIDVPPRGQRTQEAGTQAAREQSTLAAMYMTLSQIPLTPGEAHGPGVEHDDATTTIMVLSDEIQAVFPQAQAQATPSEQNAAPASTGMAMDDVQPPAVNVQELLKKLNPALDLMNGFGGDQAMGGGYDMQQQQTYQNQFGGNPTGGGWGDQSYGGGYGNGNGNDDQGGNFRGGGNRGRGRGRGRGGGGGFGGTHKKRTTCHFFLQGRCRYGDQCDFSHDS
ncbi:hypothetical protein CYLTODRAFT_366291 [Cylindrobasidium torrendii FP15055 ss-10]|uniref:C3H1-type domain-containing protein n=1 Tax=Cylindrobasidium torrendii FP15055 ss-10 TaxID=1314674 RepID=A0A0D7BUK0_9AGAR|nr:hypothetical protein CYLTODRAFT_366291 [Cylindrobasidium torrendii FP15055 ss-10]